MRFQLTPNAECKRGVFLAAVLAKACQALSWCRTSPANQLLFQPSAVRREDGLGIVSAEAIYLLDGQRLPSSGVGTWGQVLVPPGGSGSLAVLWVVSSLAAVCRTQRDGHLPSAPGTLQQVRVRVPAAAQVHPQLEAVRRPAGLPGRHG